MNDMVYMKYLPLIIQVLVGVLLGVAWYLYF